MAFLLLHEQTLSKDAGDNKRQTQCKCTRHSRRTFVHEGAPLLPHFAAEIELEFDSDDTSPLCKRGRMQMLSTENRSMQGSH